MEEQVGQPINGEAEADDVEEEESDAVDEAPRLPGKVNAVNGSAAGIYL